MDDGSFEHYNWFSSIKYKDGVATLTLTPEIKEYLVEFKHSKEFRIFASLRYILPMKSRYSKRIYLMCREFIKSGIRFCDNDWVQFKNKLGIPKTYSTSMIKKQILDSAVEEINELSDITISYELIEEKSIGGKAATAIKFIISSKNDNLIEEPTETSETKDIINIDNIKDKSDEDIEESIKQLQELLKHRKG
jgi:plasmid replication initiation protein